MPGNSERQRILNTEVHLRYQDFLRFLYFFCLVLLLSSLPSQPSLLSSLAAQEQQETVAVSPSESIGEPPVLVAENANPIWSRSPLSIQFFLGYQGLRSHGYLLSRDQRRNSRGYSSEQIWHSFKNLLLGLGLGRSSPNLQYYLQVATTLSLKENFIYDYDWLYTDKITEDAASNYARHDIVQNIMLEAQMGLGIPLFYGRRNQIYTGLGLFSSLVQWEAFDGEQRNYMLKTATKKKGKILSYGVWLLAPQVYVQFIQNFPSLLEMRLLLAYSPLTFWLDIANHYEDNLLFYGYNFFGQQVFGEVQFRFWLVKPKFRKLPKPPKLAGFAVVLGFSGRYLFESRGGIHIYKANDEGKALSFQRGAFPGSGLEQGSFQVYAGVEFLLPPKERRPAALVEF